MVVSVGIDVDCLWGTSCPGRSAKRVFALDVPGIHVLVRPWWGVDGRDKPGHDG
ncbi:hypothetical protein ACVW0J_002363 [Bradyrhizobium sp. i1.7.7]